MCPVTRERENEMWACVCVCVRRRHPIAGRTSGGGLEREGGGGTHFQSGSCHGHLGEMENLEGASARLVGVFSSDLQLLGQTGDTGGTSSRRLIQPALCSVRPQTSACLPGLVCGSCVRAKLLQLGPALCDPVVCSPQGSSVHGILQTGILEWVAVSFSRGSFKPRDQTHVSSVSCIGLFIPSTTLEALVRGGSSVMPVS